MMDDGWMMIVDGWFVDRGSEFFNWGHIVVHPFDSYPFSGTRRFPLLCYDLSILSGL